MLYETYLANLKNIPKDAMRVRVARPSVLGPSKELLKDWNDGKIDWDEYEQIYRQEILSNPEAMDMLLMINDSAKSRDVYIYCYERHPPCHRFILMEMLRG